jgi:2-phosphoglycerate kinase
MKLKVKKIIRVAVAAGLTQKNAEALGENINEWAKKKGKPQVASVQIRDRMIVEIQRINKRAADKFIWYEKLKDKHH